MANQTRSPRAVTPPKGRPTPPRRAQARGRVFGSTAQWIAVFALLLIAFVVLVLATDGGDFNPLNGFVVQAGGPVSGVDSQPM